MHYACVEAVFYGVPIMTFDQLKDKASSLPMTPGVYLMKDKSEAVIYVGKAQKLKNRVSQYFQDTASHSPKTKMMVSKIHEFDVVIAKNYLTEDELRAMSLIVNGYLDFAELRAEQHQPMTMEDWAAHLDGMLEMSRYELLTHAGKISAEVAQGHALSEFQKYRIIQDRLFQSDFDKFVLGIDNGYEVLDEIEESLAVEKD
jgi:hypothetical protein